MSLGKREAFDALQPSLTEAVQKWMDENCDGEAWVAFDSYVGSNAAGCMATAAIAVLDGIVDVQDYLKEGGELE